MEHQTTEKTTKSTSKCTCTKKIIAIEKEITTLKAEIKRLRDVLRGGR